MLQIPLTTTPNQQLAFNADGAYWILRIYQGGDTMCADITLNGTILIQGVRCYAAQGLMPYTYMYEPIYGNFVFDSIPDFNNFESTCNLYYMENSEYSQFQSDLLTGAAA